MGNIENCSTHTADTQYMKSIILFLNIWLWIFSVYNVITSSVQKNFTGKGSSLCELQYLKDVSAKNPQLIGRWLVREVKSWTLWSFLTFEFLHPENSSPRNETKRDLDYHSDTIMSRNNSDKLLLNLCKETRIRILNGRTKSVIMKSIILFLNIWLWIFSVYNVITSSVQKNNIGLILKSSVLCALLTYFHWI
jgi:ABC-type maltose transport system permease subunit